MRPILTRVMLPACKCSEFRGVKHVHVEGRRPQAIPEHDAGCTVAFIGQVPDWAAGGAVLPEREEA